MARIYTNEDLGSWLKFNGKAGEDAGYVQVNIIEFSDGFARTVGTNIPIDEFERDYKRSDEISAGPWVDLNPASLGAEFLNDIAIDPVSPAEKIAPLSPSVKTLAKLDIAEELNESPEHQLIRNAIKLSKRTSDVTINVDYNIPFDFQKLRTIVSTMEIDNTVIVDVLMENIKRHPEGFYIAIEKALVKLLNEPTCESK